jgi:hypothetical protein
MYLFQKRGGSFPPQTVPVSSFSSLGRRESGGDILSFSLEAVSIDFDSLRNCSRESESRGNWKGKINLGNPV